jgi:hypothetical protein
VDIEKLRCPSVRGEGARVPIDPGQRPLRRIQPLQNITDPRVRGGPLFMGGSNTSLFGSDGRNRSSARPLRVPNRWVVLFVILRNELNRPSAMRPRPGVKLQLGGRRKAETSTELAGRCASSGWKSLIEKTRSPQSFGALSTRPRPTNELGASDWFVVVRALAQVGAEANRHRCGLIPRLQLHRPHLAIDLNVCSKGPRIVAELPMLAFLSASGS